MNEQNFSYKIVYNFSGVKCLVSDGPANKCESME